MLLLKKIHMVKICEPKWGRGLWWSRNLGSICQEINSLWLEFGACHFLCLLAWWLECRKRGQHFGLYNPRSETPAWCKEPERSMEKSFTALSFSIFLCLGAVGALKTFRFELDILMVWVGQENKEKGGKRTFQFPYEDMYTYVCSPCIHTYWYT